MYIFIIIVMQHICNIYNICFNNAHAILWEEKNGNQL